MAGIAKIYKQDKLVKQGKVSSETMVKFYVQENDGHPITEDEKHVYVNGMVFDRPCNDDAVEWNSILNAAFDCFEYNNRQYLLTQYAELA